MSDKHIGEIFEKLSPTESQSERMYAGILRKERELRTSRPLMKRRTRTVLVTALICICTAVTVFAASRVLDSGFFTLLKPSPEQAEYLADGSYVIDKTIANRSGTLKVKQLLGDEHNLYILMDFTAPEGVVLDDARYRFDPDVTEFHVKGDHSSHGWGFGLIDDGSSADNKLSLVMTINSEGSVAGKDFSLTLGNLQAAAPYPSDFETVVEGTWKVSFPLNYKNMSHTYEISRPISLYGETLTLERVSVSPVSVNIFVSGDGAVHDVLARGRQESELFDAFPVTLVFSDGSALTTTDENSDLWQLGRNDRELTSTKTFHQVIDHTEVQSIIIFDQEFLLK